MYQELYKYFVLNKKLAIAGIGNFSISNQAAKLDFVAGVLHAPQPKVGFAQSDADIDKKLVQYLAKELKIDEKQAVQDFEAFGLTIKENLENNKSVELPGLGKLQKGYNDNKVLFSEEQVTSLSFLNDIKLNTATDSKANLVELYKTGDNLILTEETEDDRLEMIIKGKNEDYWWVYALILALMGVGALLYYYI